MYPSGQTAYLIVIPTERCVFERNERQDNRVFVVPLTVDAVSGEQEIVAHDLASNVYP